MQVNFEKTRKFAGQVWLEVTLAKGPVWINVSTVTLFEAEENRIIFHCADGSVITATGDVPAMLEAIHSVG